MVGDEKMLSPASKKAYIKVENFAQSEWRFLPRRVAPGAFAVVASVGLSWRVERRAGDFPLIFENRADAGRQLAKPLENFAHRTDVIVLGVPRGGVVVGFEVAQALRAPLDVFLSRKLGVPGQTELAFGAVSASGGRYLDDYILRTTGITSPQVEWITAEVLKELDRRAVLYRGDHPPLHVEARNVILVDDGIATGASVYAAIQALRQMHAARLVLAVPVAPACAWQWLRTVVDEIVCLQLPDPFAAVGEFYRDFTQVEDTEVVRLLQRAEATQNNGQSSC